MSETDIFFLPETHAPEGDAETTVKDGRVPLDELWAGDVRGFHAALGRKTASRQKLSRGNFITTRAQPLRSFA